MSLHRYLEKLRYIDFLIRKRATGNQRTLAFKMNLSKSGLNKLLNEMRDLGFPIKFDRDKQSYYYENEGHMVKCLFEEELSMEDMRKLTGGVSLHYRLPKAPVAHHWTTSSQPFTQ